MSFDFAHNTLILDANSLICLYASQQIIPILKAIPKTIAVATYVTQKEALWIRGESSELGRDERESIQVQPLVDSGLLQIVTIDSEEEAEMFATFASQIRDQGEAITGAIALNRNWAIVLDDEKARRLFQRSAAHLQLIYTLELVKYWVDLACPAENLIIETLQNIRKRAIYTPRKQNPLYAWWHLYQGG